ncbi:MAG: phage integrase family protein [Deltaproteobacteria bacterium]|nr:phage integrase family protein [Deltaproteobacteria bacterium]
MIKPFKIANRYNGQWMVKFRDPQGKYRTIVGGASKKAAEAKLRRILTDIERGTWIDPREQRKAGQEAEQGVKTWGDIVELFRGYYADRARSTQQICNNALKFISPDSNDAVLPLGTPISKLTPAIMLKVREGMQVKQGAVRTKNQYMTYLKMICRWAAKHPSIHLDTDPCADVEKFRTQGSRSGASTAQPIGRDEVFSLSDVEKMTEYARKNRRPSVAYLFECATSTGLRKGELFGLLWAYVDLERRVIRVCRNYDRAGTKSGRERVVPLTVELTRSLREWKAQTPYSGDTDPVFPSADGSIRTTKARWSSTVKTLAKGAGVDRPQFQRYGHMCRHFFCTQWLLQGLHRSSEMNGVYS